MIKKTLATLLVLGSVMSAANANNELNKTFLMVKETNRAQVEAAEKANRQAADNKKTEMKAKQEKSKEKAKAKANKKLDALKIK